MPIVPLERKTMKRIILALMLAPTMSFGAADYAVTWSLNQPVVSGTASYTTLQLDLNIQTRYYSGNGGLVTNGGIVSPLTGTCFDTASNGIYCNVQLDQETLNISIFSDGNGVLERKNSAGFIVNSTGITLAGIQ